MLSFKQEPASMPLILSLGSSKSGISFIVLCRIILNLLSSISFYVLSDVLCAVTFTFFSPFDLVFYQISLLFHFGLHPSH